VDAKTLREMISTMNSAQQSTPDEKSLPTIESTRVKLRPITLNDVDALFEVFSNPEVMRYWSRGPLPDREAAVELFNEIQEGVASQSMMKWGVVLSENDYLIGTATLFNLSLSNGRAEIGYAMARKYWGQGFMNEALRSLIDHAFNTVELRRIEADVDPRNAASIRTLERLGFQREGFLRERWFVENEIQDAYFYGLLRREWSNG
jgi:[ribosomal protein S5]-alanine N-acetyltransferase